jgi:biopolymer transport protein TolR
MTATNAKYGEMTSEINVTPMIDVLLVLLIIFMVIVPALPRGESALLPRPAQKLAPERNDAVVLEVSRLQDGGIAYRINQQDVAPAGLSAKLADIYANRARRQMFIKGDDQLSFNQIAEVIDLGHAAGVDQIGLMTPEVQAAH